MKKYLFKLTYSVHNQKKLSFGYAFTTDFGEAEKLLIQNLTKKKILIGDNITIKTIEKLANELL